MAQSKPKSNAKKRKTQELDSVYILKLVFYVFIGTQWLHIISKTGSDLPIPVGLILGIIFAAHDHFAIDRKVEYAVLIIAALIGYAGQIGFYLH